MNQLFPQHLYSCQQSLQEWQAPGWGESWFFLSQTPLKPDSKGPGLPTLSDSLTQFARCVHVTLCCPHK